MTQANKAVFDKFVADTKAKIAEAAKMFNVPLDPEKVAIRIDIRGRTAGYAGHRGDHYFLRFNPEAILNYNEDMTNDTIPHEVAHLVCFANRLLGQNHDSGWKRVCRLLGGDDSRCHEMTLTKAKHKTIWRFEYNVNGEVLMIGPKHHKQIQATLPQFAAIRSRATGAKITRDHFVRALADGQPVPTIVRSGMDQNVQRVQPLPVPPQRAAAPHPTKTKRQLAEEIVAANPNASRAAIIQLFIDQAGMTKAGAATYYYNIKNGK